MTWRRIKIHFVHVAQYVGKRTIGTEKLRERLEVENQGVKFPSQSDGVVFYLVSRHMRPEGPWQRLRSCQSDGGGLFTYILFLSQTNITGPSRGSPVSSQPVCACVINYLSCHMPTRLGHDGNCSFRVYPKTRPNPIPVQHSSSIL